MEGMVNHLYEAIESLGKEGWEDTTAMGCPFQNYLAPLFNRGILQKKENLLSRSKFFYFKGDPILKGLGVHESKKVVTKVFSLWKQRYGRKSELTHCP